MYHRDIYLWLRRCEWLKRATWMVNSERMRWKQWGVCERGVPSLSESSLCGPMHRSVVGSRLRYSRITDGVWSAFKIECRNFAGTCTNVYGPPFCRSSEILPVSFQANIHKRLVSDVENCCDTFSLKPLATLTLKLRNWFWS